MQASSGPHFPYVQKCQQCDGNGWDFFESAYDEASYLDYTDYKVVLPYLDDCPHCKGRGYVIPQEWTDDDSKA